MRNVGPLPVWVGLMMVVGLSGMAGATDSTEEQVSLQLKDGWSDERVAEFSRGCTEGFLAPARRDYLARAEAVGDQDPKPFPEEKVRESIAPMCSCLTLRFAQSWTYSEFFANQNALSQPLIKEALEGGQCKPGGILAAALEQK